MVAGAVSRVALVGTYGALGRFQVRPGPPISYAEEVGAPREVKKKPVNTRGTQEDEGDNDRDDNLANPEALVGQVRSLVGNGGVKQAIRQWK